MRHVRLLTVALLMGAVLASCGDDDDPTGAPVDDTAAEVGGSADAGGWTDAEIEELVATDVEGFTNLGGQVTAGNGITSFETDDGSLSALVTIAACDPFICAPLVEPDDAMMEGLRSSLSRVHLDNPDLVFEADLTTLPSGTKGLTTYSLSYVREGGSTATTHALTVRTHDERNAVVVQVTPAESFGYDDIQDLEAAMDRYQAIDVADRLVEALTAESG